MIAYVAVPGTGPDTLGAPSVMTGLPSITQIVVVVIFVSILIYVSLKYFYRKGILKPSFSLQKKWMQVLERLPLGANRSICVIRVGEKIHLIGVTEHSINLLSDLNAAPEQKECPAQ